MLIKLLKDEKSEKETTLEKIKKSTNKKYIYGTGSTGKKIAELFDSMEIKYEGFFMSDDFYMRDEDGNKSKGFLSFSDIMDMRNKEAIDIVIGFFDYGKALNMQKSGEIHGDGSVFVLDYQHLFDKAFFKKNIDEFMATYNMLNDEKSKQTMIAYIDCRMNDNGTKLMNYYCENQYFDNVVTFGQDEVFLDCGMFDGETSIEFIKRAPGYKKVICFEMDQNNIAKWKDKEKYDNVCIVDKGLWSCEKTLKFSSGDSASTICEDGDISIEVTSIDNVVKDKVTFIKMDIEGSELEALRGGENTIKRCHPKLAICVYHKKEDLIEIPKYISSLGNYNFYLRHHSLSPHELVLYAIPC